MQIQLKQAEIVAALKQYISNQGIKLEGKTVEITFTAGRRESGITADLRIENDVLIDDSDAPEDEAGGVEVKPRTNSILRAVAPGETGEVPEVREASEATPKVVANSLFS
jgi:hypothetical protein